MRFSKKYEKINVVQSDIALTHKLYFSCVFFLKGKRFGKYFGILKIFLNSGKKHTFSLEAGAIKTAYKEGSKLFFSKNALKQNCFGKIFQFIKKISRCDPKKAVFFWTRVTLRLAPFFFGSGQFFFLPIILRNPPPPK